MHTQYKKAKPWNWEESIQYSLSSSKSNRVHENTQSELTISYMCMMKMIFNASPCLMLLLLCICICIKQLNCLSQYFLSMNNDPEHQSIIFQVDEIINITSQPITCVLSFNMSLTRKYAMIGTQNGFCLVDNLKKTLKRFEGKKNPFNKQQGVGVRLGSVLEERTQVAIIPTQSKIYKKNTVYIYDYQLQTILYSNDFFLPIRQINLTDDTIVVSNNKRIVIYNYSNDAEEKTQAYYLKMYASKEPNTNLRYLEMGCEQKLMNNAIQEIDEEQTLTLKQCKCGKYAISGVKPYKIVYSKVYTLNATKMIQLSIYDWAIDKDYAFESIAYNQPFSFCISQDGNFVAYTQNEGRAVVVHKLGTKGVYCSLWVSRSVRECLSHGFFYHEDNLWYTSIRRGDNSSGNMHFWKITQKKKQDKQQIVSRYSRYFSLFEKTMQDYGITNKLIGPDFYVINGAVFSVSLCGAVVEIIDLKMSGNLDKKTVDNFIKWKEDTPL